MTLNDIIALIEKQDGDALELAWALADFFPEWLGEVGYPPASAAAREARREYLSFLHTEVGGKIPLGTLRDKFSFGRFWTRERYAALERRLGARLTYHQTRALTTTEEEVERRLKILTDWIAENETIPSVEDMRAMFDPDGLDARARALRSLQRACNRVLALEAGTRNLRFAVQGVLEFLNTEVQDE